MTCDEVQIQAPLYLSGEMTGRERRAVQSHLNTCSECHESLEAMRLLDCRVRSAFRRQAPQPLQWAAVAALVAMSLISGSRMSRIFGDAARDHRTEVARGAPRRWKTSRADVDALFVRFGKPGGRIEVPGYQLLRAKICGLAGKRVLHLVYSDGKAVYSVFLTTDRIPRQEFRDETESVAGFGKGVVVTDGSGKDCRQMAEAAAAVL